MSDTQTSHLTAEQIRRYRDRRLTTVELLAASDHIVRCSQCRSAAVTPLEVAACFERMQQSFPEHLTFEEMSQYTDRVADQDTRSRVEAHRLECDECSRELEVYEALSERSWPAVAPPKIAGSWWSRLFAASPLHGTAAGVRVAFAVGMLATLTVVWFALGRRPEPALSGNKPPAPGVEVPREAYADVLRDGGLEIRVSAGGERVDGLDRLDPADREVMQRVLLSGRLEVPAFRDLQRPRGTLMGGGTPEDLARVRILAPVGIVVESDTPVFHWSTGQAGESRVSVFDEQFRLVTESGWVTKTEWRTPKPLPRGSRYSWQLTMRRNGTEVVLPSPPASEARFRIISAGEAQELQRARHTSPRSSLLLAATYARMGLVAESESELLQLKNENPGSRLAAGLLESLHGPERPSAAPQKSGAREKK